MLAGFANKHLVMRVLKQCVWACSVVYGNKSAEMLFVGSFQLLVPAEIVRLILKELSQLNFFDCSVW